MLPNVCAKRCSWRARPRKQKLSSVEMDGIGYLTICVIERSRTVVEILDSNDGQTRILPICWFECQTVDCFNDIPQPAPHPRFRNRERRIESRAFRARRPGGCPSLRTGRVIGSVAVSIPCSSFFACFQMKNELDYKTVNPHLMVCESPPFEKANKTDKGSLVIAKSVREGRRKDCRLLERSPVWRYSQ